MQDRGRRPRFRVGIDKAMPIALSSLLGQCKDGSLPLKVSSLSECFLQPVEKRMLRLLQFLSCFDNGEETGAIHFWKALKFS